MLVPLAEKLTALIRNNNGTMEHNNLQMNIHTGDNKPYIVKSPSTNNSMSDFITPVWKVKNFCFFIYVIWVSLFLHPPEFDIQKVTVTNLSISSYSQISGDWKVDFMFRNPNSKINLYYDQIEVVVSYKSNSIAQTLLPPFIQGTNNQTTIRATLTSLMMLCVHDQESIKRSHGVITFDVTMTARVQTRVWWGITWALTVDCSNLQIAVGNGGSGTLVGGSKKCMASASDDQMNSTKFLYRRW
ncbi:hypothetical protein Lser_V15G13736 [Lactuca serriola]